MGYYRDFCPRRGKVGDCNCYFAGYFDRRAPSTALRGAAPDLGALIEERSEIRGGAITLATGVDKKFWAMGHVFATGFRPNYFSRSACGARPVSVERETNLQSASCVARRF